MQHFDERMDNKGGAALENISWNWALRGIRQLLQTSKASSRACCNKRYRCGKCVYQIPIKQVYWRSDDEFDIQDRVIIKIW